MAPYCVRLRFKINPRDRLDFSEQTVELAKFGNASVTLKSYGDVPISETDDLVVQGGEFREKEDAEEAGNRIYRSLLWSGVNGRYGFDLGDAPPSFGFFKPFKQEFKKRTGQNLRADIHGLQVYDCGEPTRFGRFSATPSVTRSSDRFRESFRAFLNASLSEKEEVALKLANLAYFEQSPRARFLTRMFAVEALLRAVPASEKARELVDDFLKMIDESDLEEDEKQSLRSRAGHMKNQSIRGTGVQFAEQYLSGREYGDEPAGGFFRTAYDARSEIAHNGTLPSDFPLTIREIDNAMKAFVRDLLLETIPA